MKLPSTFGIQSDSRKPSTISDQNYIDDKALHRPKEKKSINSYKRKHYKRK
jgi:hypothetical protein